MADHVLVTNSPVYAGMIEDIIFPPQVMGRPRRDDRKMLNGIFWIF